jgi:hypothetical protein
MVWFSVCVPCSAQHSLRTAVGILQCVRVGQRSLRGLCLLLTSNVAGSWLITVWGNTSATLGAALVLFLEDKGPLVLFLGDKSQELPPKPQRTP